VVVGVLARSRARRAIWATRSGLRVQTHLTDDIELAFLPVRIQHVQLRLLVFVLNVISLNESTRMFAVVNDEIADSGGR
jgi:hypothetical protein